MGRAFALAVAVLALAAPALAAAGTPHHRARAPLAPSLRPPEPRLGKAQVTRIYLLNGKVASWLPHYPRRLWQTEATYNEGSWKVDIWERSPGKAGEIATGRVDDRSGAVTEAWTGPQVAWKMARGYPGAFGGREINSAGIWLGFCAVFLLGLADFRRPLNIRNLDLLVLLSFSVSLLYFNRGDVFTSVPLAYPPLVYLLVRMVWSAWRGRLATASAPVWPVWALVAATIFLAGFRVGWN